MIFFTMNPNLTCKKKLWGVGGAGGQRGGGGPRVSEFFYKESMISKNIFFGWGRGGGVRGGGYSSDFFFTKNQNRN